MIEADLCLGILWTALMLAPVEIARLAAVCRRPLIRRLGSTPACVFAGSQICLLKPSCGVECLSSGQGTQSVGFGTDPGDEVLVEFVTE